MAPQIKLKDFDFNLPAKLIAQRPLDFPDQSKLMILNRKTKSIKHERFKYLPNIIPPESLMIFNDTKVLPSKLNGIFVKNGRPVEILLVRKINDEKFWESLIKGLGKLKPGTEMKFGNGELKAILEKKLEDKAILKLIYKGSLDSILNRIGKMPLPPYIRRSITDNEAITHHDRERYQTMFAKHPGAIAAPTAGLHFTPNVIESLKNHNINTAYLTLHVGVGTFQSIRRENITEHKMPAEQFYLSKSTARDILAAKKNTRKIVGVGSTTTKVLESIALNAVKLESKSGWTSQFIFPGHKFKLVDHMITNFHLPKSTLYLLVCAFAGKELIEASYKEAIKHNYRFFSYGDAMLIL